MNLNRTKLRKLILEELRLLKEEEEKVTYNNPTHGSVSLTIKSDFFGYGSGFNIIDVDHPEGKDKSRNSTFANGARRAVADAKGIDIGKVSWKV